MPTERLQKILAATGLGSRRGCEQLIEEGRVLVNGRTATLGMSADPTVDKITVDGAVVRTAAVLQTFALYKPRGVVSSLAPQGNRATVRDLLPAKGRFFPVGRLDMDSEGLILLTNDGELAQRISHPRYEVEKEYRVLVARRPTDEQLETWRRGVVLEEGVRTGPMEVVVESPEGRGAWLRVVMHEGRKHELREIGRCVGLPVVKIIRKKIGSLALGGLRPGQYRELTPAEIASLRASGKASPSRKTGWKKRFFPRQKTDRLNSTITPSRRPSDRNPASPGPVKKKPFSSPGNERPRSKPRGIYIPRERGKNRTHPSKKSSPHDDGGKPPVGKPAGKNRNTPYRKSGRRAPKG